MSHSLMFGDFKKEMTFYSWMALMQSINGTTNANRLSKTLMGNASSGLRIDFPSNLRFFCQTTSGAFGDEAYIGQNHTNLPYFTRFRDAKHWDTCISIMADKSVEFLKFHLGLPPSNAYGYAPLKYCSACLNLDLNTYGFAFWHRVHQLPTCYICPTHGDTLEFQSIREDGRDRSTLILPSEQIAERIILPERAKSTLARLSNLSHEILLKALPAEYDPHRLMHTYRHGLKEQGFLTKRGFIRADDFLLKFENHFSSIKSIVPYQEIISSNKIGNFLKLLRKPRGNHHTAEHLLIIDFLFGSWDLFYATYQWESQLSIDLNNQSELPRVIDSTDQIFEIVKRYDLGEDSLRSLCKEYGIDIGTAMRRINKLGLTSIKKRPKSLSFKMQQQVIQLLMEGTSIADIVSQTKFSKSTIDRICAENQDIWRKWKIQKNNKLRDERRGKLKSYMLMHPVSTLSELKENYINEYKWLSKHDADWINQFIKSCRSHSPPKKIVRPSKLRVDWDARDEECLKHLMLIGKPELHSWERIQPRALLRRLPKLSFVPRLNRLPKSRIWVETQLLKMDRI